MGTHLEFSGPIAVHFNGNLFAQFGTKCKFIAGVNRPLTLPMRDPAVCWGQSNSKKRHEFCTLEIETAVKWKSQMPPPSFT